MACIRSDSPDQVDLFPSASTLTHHPHEAALVRMEERLQARTGMMDRRRSLVESPFVSLKQWLSGNDRLLLHQLSGTRTEKILAVQAYNLKRAIKVLGAQG